MVVRFVPIADIAGSWYVSLRRQVMPCISLWYNSCAIDTRERYIVKIVFEVNGKKVPLKSLKYISKKENKTKKYIHLALVL